MGLLGVVSQGRISTYPSVPYTRIRCPSGISRVASTTPTTAAAVIAEWIGESAVVRFLLERFGDDSDVAGELA